MISTPEKIVCIGLNYRDHVRETGAATPAEPIVFFKAPDTVVGASDDFLRAERESVEAFVAIGDAKTRLAWIERLRDAKFALATIVHPRAIVSSGASLGQACLIVAGAIVNIGARLDKGVIVNTGASVDHDCAIGAGAHICPGVRLGGDVKVGRGAWIGIGSD